MKVIALVPAAGMGKRMGVGFNKQYILLGGQPIVGRTLQVFERLPLVDEIHVIVPEEEIPYCREHVVRAGGFTKVRSVLAGGKERQNSVLNGLRALDGCAEDDVVVIHDGVRPFVTAEMVERSVEVAGEFDGALVAVPAKDTVKMVEDGVIVDTPPRERIWLAQTPQTFQFSLLFQAHQKAAQELFKGTDDACLVERLGREVSLIPGDYHNLKITTPEDLPLAEAWMSLGSSSA